MSDEDTLQVHTLQINALHNRMAEVEKSQKEIQISQARSEINLAQIKEKLNNGLSAKMDYVYDNMVKMMEGKKRDAEWFDAFRNSIVPVVIGGVTVVVAWVVKSFFFDYGP